MSCAHENDIVMGDLEPNKVLFLSKPIHGKQNLDLRVMVSTMKNFPKAEFCAPEELLDFRTDVWSAGVIM